MNGIIIETALTIVAIPFLAIMAMVILKNICLTMQRLNKKEIYPFLLSLLFL